MPLTPKTHQIVRVMTAKPTIDYTLIHYYNLTIDASIVIRHRPKGLAMPCIFLTSTHSPKHPQAIPDPTTLVQAQLGLANSPKPGLRAQPSTKKPGATHSHPRNGIQASRTKDPYSTKNSLA